jgi:flavin reductase (DIM6/NTAB) family NADH-FMN oxidoreductase RutF/rubredoxin
MHYESFHKISYGLYIIAASHENKLNGYIANTAFQITADPPQLAISCSKENHTTALIRESGLFSVSVLRKEASSGLIRQFGYTSGKSENKFEQIEYKKGSSGVPVVLSDCVAWFECRVTNEYDAGTHLVFIGEVMETEMLDPESDVLTYEYYREVKKGVAPANAPTYIDPEKLKENPQDKPVLRKFKCIICAFIYDPEKGDPANNIPPGTPFEDLPEDYECPVCGAGPGMFTEL